MFILFQCNVFIKSKKPKVIAKTSVLFDVKPWDDETDMDVSYYCFIYYL